MRPTFHAARRWQQFGQLAWVLLLCMTVRTSSAQPPVLSGGGSQALVAGESSSHLRSPQDSTSWQHAAPASPPTGLSDQPRAHYPVVTASDTQPAPRTPNNSVGEARTVASAGAGLREVGGGDSTRAKRTPLAPRGDRSDEDSSPARQGTLQTMVSVGSSLLLVIGLFLGVAWCYRKSINSSVTGALPKQVVSVLGRTPLAARQQLVLVRFGSKLVLVSLVQGEARTLSEISDPLEVDKLAGQCESSQPGSITQSFRSVLQQGAAT